MLQVEIGNAEKARNYNKQLVTNQDFLDNP